MSDNLGGDTATVCRDCGGDVLIEVEIRQEGYQPRFYLECDGCGTARSWNPGGWS